MTNPPDISTDGAKFYFLDKNNIELGSVYSGVYAENKTIKVNWSRLLAYSKDKNKAQRIEIQVAEDGKGILYAPSLVNGEDMMPVTTTDWVNNKISTTNSSLKRAKYSDSYFYRQYSDGWVIQGVYNTTNPTPPLSKQITITFPIIMSDTNYMVCIGQTGRPDSANVCRSTVVSKTTTTITVNIGTPSYFIIVGMGG